MTLAQYHEVPIISESSTVRHEQENPCVFSLVNNLLSCINDIIFARFLFGGLKSKWAADLVWRESKQDQDEPDVPEKYIHIYIYTYIIYIYIYIYIYRERERETVLYRLSYIDCLI